jgi:hypothetical protein
MSLTTNLTPQRIVIAACCGLLATGALYATQQQPPMTSAMEPATLVLPAVAAALPGQEALPAGAPRSVRRVVVTHDRPGQIVFSWDGPDLKVEIIDAAPSKASKGASAL